MEPYYEDDLVTLYHGDCREITAWLEADVLVTDPPYGVAWVQGRLGGAGGIERRRAAAAKGQSIAGDESVAARDDILRQWGKRPALVFGSWRLPRPQGTAHRLIWHKAGRYAAVSPHRFYELGVPIEELNHCADIACGNQKVRKDEAFRYFAGCVWRVVTEMQQAAKDMLESEAVDGS